MGAGCSWSASPLPRSPSTPADKQREFELTVYLGQSVQIFPLAVGKKLSMGRSSQCDIQLEDVAVSRQHLRFCFGEVVTVEDLGSTNGTFLVAPSRPNHKHPSGLGQPLHPREPVVVQVGDSVRVGSTIVMLRERVPVAAQITLRPPVDGAGTSDLWWPAILVNPGLRHLYEQAALAAGTDIAVLILGETGVGKEVFAEFIHRRSPRHAKFLLRLNCAAISESLLESELFGHEKGAFTGAIGKNPGLLESTDGGTVFLDEIGELPLPLQAKLLRVLEEGVVRRVGSNRPRPVDLRFISASNRDLRREVAAGRFRSDLYFRLAGTSFSIPPLRDRSDEIVPLARHFLDEACHRLKRPAPQISPEAQKAMLEYSWWGNVRELKNAMDRASFLCEGGPLLPEHLPAEPLPTDEHAEGEATDTRPSYSPSPVPQSAPSRSKLRPSGVGLHFTTPIPRLPASWIPTGEPPATELPLPEDSTPLTLPEEHRRIQAALSECGGNQTRAAHRLGISRRTLINRLEEYNLPRPRKGHPGRGT